MTVLSNSDAVFRTRKSFLGHTGPAPQREEIGIAGESAS